MYSMLYTVNLGLYDYVLFSLIRSHINTAQDKDEHCISIQCTSNRILRKHSWFEVNAMHYIALK